MIPVTVRSLTLGAGRPKICIPLTASDLPGLTAAAGRLGQGSCDLAEWRVDYFEHLTEPEALTAAAEALREALGDMPILATVRTASEGGRCTLGKRAYREVLRVLCTCGCIDLVDIEAYRGSGTVRAAVRTAHANGVLAVLSNHDFHATPKRRELLRRLAYMRTLGCDIAKIAVMPTCSKDVMSLLRASSEAAELLDCPVITVSMGRQGAASRIAGELFGSAVTFATAGDASAPGQIPAALLAPALDAIHACLDA